MSIRDFINVDFFFNFKLLLKINNVIPTYEVNNLTEIADIMDKCHVSAAILDVDQTLVPFEEIEINDEIRNFLRRISNEKRCCLLSNVPRTERRVERIRMIEEKIGIQAVFADKRKPSPMAFRAALAFLDSEPSRTLMVGDRIFTDIMGANNLGIPTVLVPPLNPKTDPFLMVKLPRFFERYYLKLARWFKNK